jgi:hypothetical protein
VDDFAETESQLVRRMDEWLGGIERDTLAGSMSDRILRNLPRGLSDGCRTVDGQRISEKAVYSRVGKCNQMYPPYGTPRLAAGGPLGGEVLKCSRKPIDSNDYSRPLTAKQLARLRAVFPTGVCDYGRPGVGQDIVDQVSELSSRQRETQDEGT